MPRLSLFIPFFIFSASVVAQTKLAGYVVEINSGKQKVAGYSIKSVGANTITTENNGQFMLVFANAQPGNPVMIAAQKNGWQVVNSKELNTILPNKADAAPMKITVCKAGYLEKARKEYYNITDSYITKEYEKRLKAINRQKEGWQKEAAELDEKLQLLNKQISEMADEYSLTNLDDLNETERKAVELFKAGDIDSSIKVRESLHSGEKIKTAITTKKQLDSVIAANENNLKQLANAYILKYDFAKAEKTYEELAMADTANFDNVFDFASFLDNQNKLDKAIKSYKECLKIARGEAKTNLFTFENHVAITQNNLGMLYMDKNDFPMAEEAFLESLEIFKRLVKNNPDTYKPYLATIQNNLGRLLMDKNDYLGAEIAFLESLEIRKQLAKIKPAAFEGDVAMTQNNLAILYQKKNNYPEAEAAYLGTLEIYIRLAKSKPAIYEPYLAITQSNLGVLYKDKNNYQGAEIAYLEALEIRKRLAKSNPATYEKDIASIQNNLGGLYRDKNNYQSAEAAYLESLEIRKRLAKIDPATYEKDVASTQNNLGILYCDKKNYPEAEAAYFEALEIRKHLAITNPDTYEPDVASTQNNLGILYIKKKNYPRAEVAFLEVLEIWRRLAITSPDTYEPNVASIQNNLGMLYFIKNNYREAETAYLEALDIRKRLAKTNPNTYEPDVSQTQINLGSLYIAKYNYSEAELAYLEAFAIYKKSAALEPNVYNPVLCGTIVLIGYLQQEDFKLERQSFIDSIFILAKTILSNNKDLATKTPYLTNIQTLEKTFFEKEIYFSVNNLEKKLLGNTTNNAKINVTLEIIKEYHSIISNGLTIVSDKLGSYYGNLAWYQLFEKQFVNAEQSAIEALNPKTFKKNDGYDSAMVWVNTNLALALLFQGKYAEAEKIYLAFKDKPLGNATYKETFLSDLDELEKAGITHKDVEKIKTLLNK